MPKLLTMTGDANALAVITKCSGIASIEPSANKLFLIWVAWVPFAEKSAPNE